MISDAGTAEEVTNALRNTERKCSGPLMNQTTPSFSGLATLEDLKPKLPARDELSELRALKQLGNRSSLLESTGALQQKPLLEQREVPAQFALSEAFPNPFKPSTCVGLALPVGAHVRFVVSDLLGHVVKVVSQGYFEAGYHSITWDARTAANLPVSSGLYYAHLVVTDGFGKALYSKTNKLLLMK